MRLICSSLGFGLGLWLALGALAGCSDDGLSPEGAGTAGDGGAAGSTGSISTTVTASAGSTNGPGSSADDGSPDGDGTAGFAESGGSDGGPGESTGAVSGSTTGEPPGDGTDGSSGTTGGSMSGGACESDADCVVLDDCCSCAAAAADGRAPVCDEECDTTQCESAGLSGIEAECVFGTCQLAKVSCGDFGLTCDTLPPDCPDGMLPSVDDVESCWTGLCVPADACDVVPSCDWCAKDQSCVQTATQIGFFYSCWPTNPECEGAPSCDCMAEVCTAPFICSDPGAGSADLGCVCPVCG